MRPAHPLQLIAGLAVWSLWFIAIYGGLSVACQIAPPEAEAGALNRLNLMLGLLTLATLAFLLWNARRCWQAINQGDSEEARRQRFLATLGAGLHLVGAIATLFVGIPILVMPPCL
ncbi:hypothetical protein ACFQDN_25810 [Pseudomonas asuensis]|uniref:DUF4234 domain-containing protein n=1 Tax=Pseudomonas asuensis TaxID=1825787 RepID=A0ABQ2GXJ0_9PSED|nr:hypothetical protein [Pseudomonas asuensis]GGM17060.1 hypothetical protein GCM10009425_30080 [Pseudomonas asuensis]